VTDEPRSAVRKAKEALEQDRSSGEFLHPEIHDTYRVLLADLQGLQAERFPCLGSWGSEYFYIPTV
jgi:hypothetical protein